MNYNYRFEKTNAVATFPTITTSVCTSGVNCTPGQTCRSNSQCATGNCCAYVYNTTYYKYSSMFYSAYPQYNGFYFNSSANGTSYTTNPGYYSA